jgi:hypothetical protein
LKERGEDALTMRTGLSQHGQDGEREGDGRGDRMKPLKRTMSAPGLTGLKKNGSGSVSASSKRDGSSSTNRNRKASPGGDTITPVAPALHPVKEEDH